MVDLSALANLGDLGLSPGLIALVLVIAVWKLIWYGIAIYKSLQKQQKTWFVVLFVAAILLNDLGILAIIYLLIYRDKKKGIAKPAAKKK